MIAVISLITILAGSALTSFISWRVTDGILKPLEDVVNAAFKISEQNDLSKRIPMKSKNKDEVGVLIEVMNKTFERLEELLMSQQRFLADVSHDLRTPLTVIKGNAELMRKTGWADAESANSREIARAAPQRHGRSVFATDGRCQRRQPQFRRTLWAPGGSPLELA